MKSTFVLLLTLITIVCPAALAGSRLPAAEIVHAYADDELITGFLGTVFGAEATRGGGADRAALGEVKKFRGRVRVHIINLGNVDHTAEVVRFIRLLASSVHGLKIGLEPNVDRANMVVFLVDRADYRSTIRQTMEGTDSRFLEQNDCSAATLGRRDTGLERAFVFVVADTGGRNFRHCMIEEITQSLGPVNDNPGLPFSIYNDRSDRGTFGLFDWFILNMLYDRRIRVGMTPAQAVAVLPAVIADARRRLPGVVRRTPFPHPRTR